MIDETLLVYPTSGLAEASVDCNVLLNGERLSSTGSLLYTSPQKSDDSKGSGEKGEKGDKDSDKG